jgi:hypothetical protein
MELVQKLLLSGNTKILNKVDKDGDGALHRACADQTFDVVKLLVDQMEEKHMNINVRNIYGDNALVYAIENLEIMQLLVQTGKLDIKRNPCVSNYVDLWGSISFVCDTRLCDTDESSTGKFVVKMDSRTVVNSIQKSDKTESRLGRRRFSQKTNKRKKQKSKKITQILSFERIYGAPICFRFYLTFNE